MYLGQIVELGAAADVALRPKHPYTQALFSAALPLDPGARRDEIVRGAAAFAGAGPPGRLSPLPGRGVVRDALPGDPHFTFRSSYGAE